ncbi:hypothetical protein CRG98_017273 [Punica granatum]|uniref:Uncharacterized protein n=1 Tax=Punica granatum TaxID=22663 RepID=A0A2I0K198_PUNGR|nr:hypothetical protein CRG98_017273 [Punica granatum]
MPGLGRACLAPPPLPLNCRTPPFSLGGLGCPDGSPFSLLLFSFPWKNDTVKVGVELVGDLLQQPNALVGHSLGRLQAGVLVVSTGTCL